METPSLNRLSTDEMFFFYFYASAPERAVAGGFLFSSCPIVLLSPPFFWTRKIFSLFFFFLVSFFKFSPNVHFILAMNPKHHTGTSSCKKASDRELVNTGDKSGEEWVEQACMLRLNKESGGSWGQGQRGGTNLGCLPWNSAARLRMCVKNSRLRAFPHSSIRTWRIVVDYKLMRFADGASADGCMWLVMHRCKPQLGGFMVTSNRKAAVLVSCIAI